jgi:hypothetical protein
MPRAVAAGAAIDSTIAMADAHSLANEPNPFPKSVVDIYESEVPAILKSFSVFLGEDNLKRRIETAEKMFTRASPIYGEYFVRRKQFLWIGAHQIRHLIQAKQFRQKSVTPSIAVALHHIASIRNVVHTMPSWKKNDFRSRLTDKSGSDLPALIEIAAASRIVTLGGKIRWIPEQERGKRVFDILASYQGIEFEVECKAKTVDAGRKFSRGALYQFADRLLASEIVMSSKQPLLVSITMDSRFPVDHQHQNALIRILEGLIGGGGTKEAGPGCDVSIETLTAEELEGRARMELDEFEHRLAIRGLVVSFRSRKSDQMIANFEADLRDALKQFSGNRPAVIVCYVPEIDSFAGVEKAGTETYALVHRFLTREDAQNIVSLTFASDPIIDFRPDEIDTGLPSVRFVVHKFRGSHLEKF